MNSIDNSSKPAEANKFEIVSNARKRPTDRKHRVQDKLGALANIHRRAVHVSLRSIKVIVRHSLLLYLSIKFILSTFSFILISFNIACVCTFVARCWSYSIVLLQYRRSVILDKIFVTHGLLKTIVWRNGIQLHLFNLINAASTMQLNIQSINHIEPCVGHI